MKVVGALYVIGCDVGSQSLKGVLLDADGRPVASAASGYPVQYPAPGWAQQDALAWRSAMADVVGTLLTASGVAAGDVAALGLATQVDGLVAIDGRAEPLAPAIIWLDRRAAQQTETMRVRITDEDVRQQTGLNLDASHVAPKIRWLFEQHPDLFERAAGLLLPGSALVAWLTGEHLVDHANASSTLLYDIAERSWSPRLLDAFGLDAARFGSIADATDVAGPLTRSAAAELGLTTGTRVVVGTGDEHGACLGAGAIRPGIVVDITGTAEPVATAATSPTIDPTGLVETHAHADPRVWLVENPGFVSGGSVTWFRSALADGRSAAELDAEAEAHTTPGAEGLSFLPTMSGATTPRWNDRARGVFAGMSLHHQGADLYRALLEGCTFAVRDIVDRLDELGLGADEVRVVGGGARSPFWLQMKADITGRPVRVLAADEATAMGAGMLAMVGAGLAQGLDEAVDRCVRVDDRTYDPDQRTRAAYADGYARYRALFDAVEPTWASAATEPAT